jgi:hypothetical protein
MALEELAEFFEVDEHGSALKQTHTYLQSTEISEFESWWMKKDLSTQYFL